MEFTESRFFRGVVFSSVLANSIQYGIQVDHPDLPGYALLENVFTGVFTLEMLLKLFFQNSQEVR